MPLEKTMIEIEASIHREVYRNGDFCIFKATMPDGEEVSIKGTAEEGAFGWDQSYRLWGLWTSYKNSRTGQTEQTFEFRTFVQSVPISRAGIIKYLADAGQGHGLGRARAAKLYDRYKQDTVKVCRESPAEACESVAGWLQEQAEEVAKILRSQQATEHCLMELMDLLDRRGFRKSAARTLIFGNGEDFAGFGNLAAEMIKRNPYLMMKRVKGAGFRLCDKMYLDLGLSPGRLKRQSLCAWHGIASDTSGHTWFPLDVATSNIRTNVSGTELRINEALLLAKRSKMLAFARTEGVHGRIIFSGGTLWVAEEKNARAEEYIARHLADAASEVPCWPALTSTDPTPHQVDSIGASLAGVIGILGGSPGTGKTFTAAALIKAIVSEVGEESVAICAPTGKAAVRITEAMQGYGINLRARTIHSTLGVMSTNGGFSFQHNEANPLPHRFIIVDESSMIDTNLMRSLLSARSRGTHVLFVGDINQLLPVGHGAPIRDMIRAGIPYGELREVRRNSGAIVQACADMRDGKKFRVHSVDEAGKEEGANLVHIECGLEKQQIQAMQDLLRALESEGHDPVWDCQVLVPVNRKSELCRKTLNGILQNLLNKSPGIQGSPFRVGDKIVNTKNGYFPLADEVEEDEEDIQTNDDGEVYVANGELAVVLDDKEKMTIAELSSPYRVIKIPRGKQEKGEGDDEENTGTGCSWELGYALSVHKSQGSEWPVAIVMIDEYPGAKMVAERSWHYTAISRAKKLCITVGKLATMHQRCRRVAINGRKTLLEERIKQVQSELLIAEI